MFILSKPTSAAGAAVVYVTVGVLVDVWSGIWYAYLHHTPPENDSTWFWCYGFMLTGLALAVIGMAIGRIGRSARHAEIPPPEVMDAARQAEKIEAGRPVIAPVATSVPVSPSVPATPPMAVPVPSTPAPGRPERV